MTDTPAPNVTEPDAEEDEWEGEPRALFARTWVRVLLVLVVVGAAAGFSIPYVIETVGTSAGPSVITPAAPSAAAPAVPAVTSTAQTVPAEPPHAVAPAKQTPPTKTTQTASAPDAPKGDARRAPVVPPGAAQKSPTPTPGTETTKATSPEPKASMHEVAAARSSAATDRPASNPGGATGDYWVQVGAYQDPSTASRVAARLRSHGYRVLESTLTHSTPATAETTAPAANDEGRYEVVVTGAPFTELGPKLTSKGLSVEPTAAGAVVRPSLPLHDAVALSKDLRDDGFAVQVERVPAGAKPRTARAGGGETLHRVRVGAFADRASAVAAVRELETLGYRPFVGSGRD